MIPKGNLIRGLQLHQAAAREAFEEAGISGIPCPTSIGHYHYGKRRGDGSVRQATVEVFPLAVVSQFDDWPEQAEREVRWFTSAEAADAVDEPELKSLITGFREPPRVVGRTERALGWARAESGRKLPMVRWFQALMPDRGRFFELFEAHAGTLVAGADSLARLVQGGPDMAEHCRAVYDRENEADDIAREVLMDVRRIFVTPFDRSAITSLIGAMDDAIDQMNKTAKAVMMFDVRSFEPQMNDLAGIIVEAARITAEAVPLLRSVGTNGARLHALTERIVRIEGHSDEIHDVGLKALFKAASGKPMDFIVGQEIYDHLEKVVDCFEDVANEIQGLVIDHA